MCKINAIWKRRKITIFLVEKRKLFIIFYFYVYRIKFKTKKKNDCLNMIVNENLDCHLILFDR